MATRLYKIGPNENEYQVTEAVGSAVATKSIELTVDLVATAVGGTRALTKDEVILALKELSDYIAGRSWPPA